MENAAAELTDSAYTRRTGSVPLGRIITHPASPSRNLNQSVSSMDCTM